MYIIIFYLGNSFSQCVTCFIGCVSGLLLELKRCHAMESTFPIEDAPLMFVIIFFNY